MIENQDKQLTFSRIEAAKRLGISIPTLDRQIAKRRISHFRVGRRILFTQNHIHEYIAQNERKARTNQK